VPVESARGVPWRTLREMKFKRVLVLMREVTEWRCTVQICQGHRQAQQ